MAFLLFKTKVKEFVHETEKNFLGDECRFGRIGVEHWV